MSSEQEGASLTTDDMDEQPWPSLSRQGSEGKAKENEDLSGKGEGNEGKQEFRSPKTTPMLPPETWLLSLSHLSEPTDFLTVINTCLEWNELLHSKKTVELLPLALPLVMKYLSFNDSLLLRQVHPEWKKVVDSTFQRLSTHPQENFEADIELSGLESDTRISRFSQRFPMSDSFLEDTASWLVPEGNLFLHGRTEIRLDPYNWDSYIRTLLCRFGAHISNLTCVISPFEPREAVAALSQVLSVNYLPNLKNLKLTGSPTEVFVQEMREQIESFHEMDSLEALDLTGLHVHPSGNQGLFYLPLLERYGSKLKVFRCREDLFLAPEISVDMLNNLLPNVRCLKALLSTFKGSQNLFQVGWTVEQLYLHVFCVPFVSFQRIINKFAPTLTHIRVKYRRYPLGQRTEEEARLEREEMRPFPNLKKLTVSARELGMERISEFVERCCPNLQQICFDEYDYSYLVNRVTKEELVAATKNTLFGLVPKLRKIVMCVRVPGENGSKARFTIYKDD